MKIFIAKTSEDAEKTFGDVIKHLRQFPTTKVYLIGELGYDWELVDRFHLEGLVKVPADLKPLILKSDKH